MMGSCFSHKQRGETQSNAKVDQSVILPSSNRYLNQLHEVTMEEQFNQIVNDSENNQILIVCDFYAIWCPPCSQIAPTVHKWATNDYRTNVIFIKIDVDQANDLSNRFSIHVLPTFVLLKEGKEILRLSGADSSTLKKEIDKYQ